MPVRKGSKKLGASPGLFSKDTLGDDETRLARYSQLNAKEKARVRAGEKAKLAEAASNRYRPLTLRAVGGIRDFLLNNRLTNDKTRAIIRKENAEASADTKAREKSFQKAKKFASRSDKERDQEFIRYKMDNNRTLKIDDYPFLPPDPHHGGMAKPLTIMAKGGKVKKMAKGGSVSASRRGDGIARKGKTKGRFV
jgi:hypothetical protein